MDNRAIGLFDSGLGGLTALSELQRLMPTENIIYFADTGRVPYGSKTPEQLHIMAGQDLEFLASMGVKAIIAACGTVSSTAADVLEGFRLPVFGVLKPSVERACALGGNAPIGVIATAASIKSGAYERSIKAISPEREVISVPCPDFVTLIESGHRDKNDPLVMAAVEKYLAPVKAAHASVLILGCTHYGLIAPALREYLGEDIILVSASGCAAAAMKQFLEENGLCGGNGEECYYTSGSASDFSAVAPLLLQHELHGSVNEVPTMEVNT